MPPDYASIYIHGSAGTMMNNDYAQFELLFVDKATYYPPDVYKATITKRTIINCDTCNRPISARTMVWRNAYAQRTICHGCYSKLHAKHHRR